MAGFPALNSPLWLDLTCNPRSGTTYLREETSTEGQLQANSVWNFEQTHDQCRQRSSRTQYPADKEFPVNSDESLPTYKYRPNWERKTAMHSNSILTCDTCIQSLEGEASIRRRRSHVQVLVVIRVMSTQ